MGPADLSALLAGFRFGAYVLSLHQTILYWNERAERILGIPAAQAVGRRCYELETATPGPLTPSCLGGCPLIAALRRGEIPRPGRLELLCGSGERRELSVTPMAVALDESDAPLLVYLFDDGPAPEPAASEEGAVLDDPGRAISSEGIDPPERPAIRLSHRQLQVLRLMALGRRTAQIAAELGITEHTVRNHIRHLRAKLDARTQLDAVVAAMRLGILDPR